MDLETILQTLEYNTGRFPREALRVAIARREEITPLLLSIIEDAADDIEFLLEEPYIAHLYAFFLLAQFREERAYPLLVEFFSIPGEMVMEVASDFVTEDLGRVLASVSGGDLGPMKALVEAPSVNEYVRAAALGGMVTLFVEGVTPRDEIIAYFRHLFQGGWERPTEFLWAVLVNCSLDLYAEDLMPEIQQAFADDVVDEDHIGLAWVERCMEEGKAANLWQLRRNRHYHFVEDTIREMEWWACFERPPKLNQEVGRNDPCPCGSGRKYKHCCGRPR